MIVKSNTKFVIFISFSIVLLLLVALIAIAIKSISDNQQQVLSLKNHSETESLVYDMRDTAHTRTLLIYRMASMDDPFDRDELWMEFKGIAQNFIVAKETLEAKNIKPTIREHFETALESSGPGAKAQNETLRLLFDEDDQASANEVLNEKVMPLQKTVIATFSQLLENVRENISISINELSSENMRSIMLITILGGIAVLLGTIIAIYVIKHTMRSERAFIEQKELAEQANNAKSMFLANMSHEIRSPLTAIIGFSDSILHRNLNENKKKLLTQSIARNSKHLHQIINDILDLSKIEAGQLDIEKVTTPINILFTELNSMVSLQTTKKGLTFNINYDFPLPEQIDTDPTRLKQILVNLTNNATKFTSKGGITIHVSYDSKTDKIHFSVADTGIGMTEEQANNIFFAFSQADSSTTRKFGGTGLGLSISKQLTENLGGTINCQSHLGKGSTFSFYVNAGVQEGATMLHNIKELEIESTALQPHLSDKLIGHVLLAEDTKDNQDLIEMYVEDTGAKITIVENGELAVEQCRTNSFNLILMDMQMPVMDGVEAITKIRSLGIKTPIISLTANAMRSDVEKCFNAGADKFLTKPIDVSRFNQALSKYLKRDENQLEKTTSRAKKEKTLTNKMEKFIHRFINDLPRRLELIDESKNKQDWQKVNIETHKLKGLGTTMGFPEITNICAEISQHCNDETYDPVPELVTKLNDYSKSIL